MKKKKVMGKPKYMAELVSVKDLKNNPNNPRLIKDDKFKKLVQSIKDFPEMLNIRPIVVNEHMIILGGNMRYKACLEAGLKEVPIIKVDRMIKLDPSLEVKRNGKPYKSKTVS